MFRNLLVFKDFFKKYKKNQIFIMIFFILSYFGIIVRPYIFGKVIDQISRQDIEYISFRNYLILFGFSIILDYLINMGWNYYLWSNSYLFERDTRNDIMNKLLRQKPKFFKKNSIGSIMSKSTEDVNNCGEMVSYGIMTIIDGVMFPLIVIILLIRISFPLTTIALVIFPVFVYILYNLNKAHDKKYLELQESFDRMNESTLEGVNSIKVIKSFMVEELFLDKFYKRTLTNSDKDIERGKIVQKYMPTNLILSSILVGSTILGGIFLIKLDRMTIGALITFQMYMTYLDWPAYALSDLFVMSNSSKTSYERIRGILNYKDDIVEKKDCKSLSDIKSIEYSGLSFSYPGEERTVLKDINLQIPLNKTTIVVGKTGSGKTSLIKLLLRLYNYQEGKLLINDLPIEDYCLSDLSKVIAYVPQENYLFSKSIKENIDLFRGFTEKDILDSTKLADFYKDLIEFPEKLETMTGEKGVNLSGGQRQRIALARGIIDNRKILILDDVFSAVDTDTERNIINNLKAYRNEATNIFTTHRFSVIGKDDYVIVMEEGRIAYKGSHEEVYQASTWYKEQYDRQEADDTDEA